MKAFEPFKTKKSPSSLAVVLKLPASDPKKLLKCVF